MMKILYYHEICFGIFTVYGILYSREQLCEALNAAGLTRKVIIIFIYSILLEYYRSSSFFFKNEVLEYRAREQSVPLRALYWQFIRRFSARQIVFFDETHVKPNDLRRKYGLSMQSTTMSTADI